MKLSDIMSKYGWSSYELDKPANKLKVYQKDDLLLGVQKIGNVFRLDIQQCLNFGGQLMPMNRLVNNEIIPRDELEPVLDKLLVDINEQQGS
jgi:hypothetical protein